MALFIFVRSHSTLEENNKSVYIVQSYPFAYVCARYFSFLPIHKIKKVAHSVIGPLKMLIIT